MEKDIFDLYDISDLPNEMQSDLELSLLDKIVILLKYANRPLTINEIHIGLIRKYNFDKNRCPVDTAIRKRIDIPNFQVIKEGRVAKYFIAGNKEKSSNKTDVISNVCELLEYTDKPVSINNIIAGLFKKYNVFVSRSVLKNKLETYIGTDDSKIQKDNGQYSLKERTKQEVNPDYFSSEFLFKEPSLCETELKHFMENGQNAILEILKKYGGKTVNELQEILKNNYGLKKSVIYIRKALQGMITKQNLPIVCDKDVYFI